jgi:hypothetical protein
MYSKKWWISIVAGDRVNQRKIKKRAEAYADGEVGIVTQVRKFFVCDRFSGNCSGIKPDTKLGVTKVVR